MTEWAGSGTPTIRRQGKYSWYVVTWYDRVAYMDLCKWNCVPAKSKILQPPVGLPQEMIRHVIRGYNDGDGGVYPGRKAIRMRGTEAFLTWVQKNLPAKSIVYPNGPTAQLFSHGRYAIENARWLYEDAEHYMDRKREAAMMLYGE